MVFLSCSGYKTLVHIKKIRVSCLKVDIGPKNHTFMTFICRNTTLDCSKMCMYSIYVVYLCILSMQSIYVCILSMKTRLQNQNFTIFKIALNRVLTLPADRARCTDHFAGSGSKIENKNISVVAKH